MTLVAGLLYVVSVGGLSGEIAARREGHADPNAAIYAAVQADIGDREARLLDIVDSVKWTDDQTAEQRNGTVRKMSKTADGYLCFMSTDLSAHFDLGDIEARRPEEAAAVFTARWKSLLVGDSPASDLVYLRTVRRGMRSHVRYKQTFGGLDVYGAEVIVRVDGPSTVTRVVSGASTRTWLFENETLSLEPVIQPYDARETAVQWLSEKYSVSGLVSSEVKLLLFDPSAVGWKGSPVPVWSIPVTRADQGPFEMYVFVNARSGDVVYHYSKVFEALDRHVRDAGNDPQIDAWAEAWPDVRPGDPGSTFFEANLAFDYLEESYDFCICLAPETRFLMPRTRVS